MYGGVGNVMSKIGIIGDNKFIGLINALKN